MLVGELLLLEVDQLAERHPQDGVGLDGRERVLLGDAALLLELGEALVAQRPLQHRGGRLDRHQPLLGLGLRRRRADDADHFVDVGVRQQQALDRVLAPPGPGQQELRPAADHRHAVPDELLQQLLERQHPRLAVDQRQEDERERVLQRRELVELVEHDVGIGVALQLDHQPDRLLQVALVADAGDARDPAFVDRRRRSS